MAIDDETLMAYADGALDADTARAVERAMAADEALAARVAAFADTRAAVKAAHAVPPAVPDALAARVRAMAEADAQRRAAPSGATVVDLAARRRAAPALQLALAASLALAVGGLSGWLLATDRSAPGGAGFAGLDDPGLAEALSTLPSGERAALPGGAELAAIATFRDGEGTLCREFEYDRGPVSTVVAVACRGEASWDLRLAVTAPAAEDGGYAPASSLDTVEAFLSATGAGAPMSAAEERAALDAGR